MDIVNNLEQEVDKVHPNSFQGVGPILSSASAVTFISPYVSFVDKRSCTWPTAHCKLFLSTISTAIFEYAALFRKPSFGVREMALVKPFTKSLWLAIFSWVLAMTVTAHALQSRIGQTLVEWDIYPAATIRLKSSECSQITASMELRVLAVTGAIVGFVLHAAYSAILYSFLSLPAKGSWEMSSKRYMFAVRDEDLFLFEQKIASISILILERSVHYWFQHKQA